MRKTNQLFIQTSNYYLELTSDLAEGKCSPRSANLLPPPFKLPTPIHLTPPNSELPILQDFEHSNGPSLLTLDESSEYAVGMDPSILFNRLNACICTLNFSPCFLGWGKPFLVKLGTSVAVCKHCEEEMGLETNCSACSPILCCSDTNLHTNDLVLITARVCEAKFPVPKARKQWRTLYSLLWIGRLSAPNFFWFDLSFRFEIKSLSLTYQYLVDLHHGYLAHHGLSKGFRPSKTDSLYVAENPFETRQNRPLTLLMQFATSTPTFKNKILQIESTKLTLNSPSQKTQEKPSLWLHKSSEQPPQEDLVSSSPLLSSPLSAECRYWETYLGSFSY